MSAQLELDVENIKCGGCAQTIRDGLTPMEGIETIDVDISSGHVSITGSNLSEEPVANKLAELGFPVKGN
ncbi:MAG: heavy-metal-associated domain-containing protein [Gammaproteobacteria bacterium]|nr:heavy-metal-associated domain-containing protein [Gammaproteobacteria bacterium]